MGKRKHKVQSVDELMADCAGSDESSSESVETKNSRDEVEEKPLGRKKAAKKHKQSLENLKKQDPEFYEFLAKEDKELLSFNPDEVEDSDEASDASEDEKGDGKTKHKAPIKLEVATDSEEDDSETEAKSSVKPSKSKKQALVTMKMVRQWSESLKEHNSLQALHQCVSAFKAAVHDTGNEESPSTSKYKVEGSSVFNAIVRVCIMDLLPMLNRFLKLPEKSKNPRKPVLPSSSDKWKRVKMDVKSYLTDMLQLISQMSEPVILNVILKHVHQLVTYYTSFPKLLKILLKKLIGVWSSGEETSRVLAFLSIVKLTRIAQDSMLEYVMKQMYMSYVQNCKFTSPNTLPLINFMQRSMVEIFAIDLALTYQYAFIYIRQLAIHLRNAITVKKKETCQAVYNWQYVHSLHLWSRLLSQLHPNETLEPLIYPLTQVIIGTIKLIPTARYYPLRFHCIRSLNMLTESTNTFIPTLPFITEMFQLTDFNKKHKGGSFKPFNFACILKLSKTQLQEKAFKDGVIDQIYDLLLESFSIHSNSIGFPELALPAVIQIKEFLKKCKIANYTKVIKQILDKVQETSNTIAKKRKASGLQLNDTKGIATWERNIKADGTPLSKQYAQYKKKRAIELQHEIAGKDRISSENLPTIERRPILGKATAKERKEFKGLFESDSEEESSDEEEDTNRFLLKEERPKKKRKTENKEDDSDQYSDFDDNELEALNKSASEEDDDDDEDSDESESEEKESETGADKDEAMDSDVSDHGDIVKDFEFSDIDDSD